MAIRRQRGEPLAVVHHAADLAAVAYT